MGLGTHTFYISIMGTDGAVYKSSISCPVTLSQTLPVLTGFTINQSTLHTGYSSLGKPVPLISGTVSYTNKSLFAANSLSIKVKPFGSSSYKSITNGSNLALDGTFTVNTDLVLPSGVNNFQAIALDSNGSVYYSPTAVSDIKELLDEDRYFIGVTDDIASISTTVEENEDVYPIAFTDSSNFDSVTITDKTGSIVYIMCP